MLNAAASHAGKQAGQQLALDMAGDWKVQAVLELRGWLAIHQAKGHSTMTFEQFRHDARAQPASSKAWGSLPGIACKAGLIAPVLHEDGSPVMRRAESVKTHAHPVRVWRIVAAFFAPAASVNSPHSHDPRPSVACNQPSEIARVGDGRQGVSLMDACAQYHRGRADMDQAMGGEN